MKDQTTIYVMSHKEYPIPVADFYSVVGLGRFVGRDGVSDSDGFFSIAELNKYYCELTGINYVGNASKSKNIGICHYRRYFNFLNNSDGYAIPSGWIKVAMGDEVRDLLSDPRQSERIEMLLDNYDLILPKAIYSDVSVAKDYTSAHGCVEWPVFLDQLDSYYGANSHSLRIDRRNFYCNMLICKRELFKEYCSQLFSVIDGVFHEVGVLDEVEGVRYQPYRYPGYLAERFMTAFVNSNNLKYYEADVIVTD